jgi:hypothetical protein
MIYYAQETLPQVNIIYYQNWQDALTYLQNETLSMLILVKGSTFGYTKGLCELVQALTIVNPQQKTSKTTKATI